MTRSADEIPPGTVQFRIPADELAAVRVRRDLEALDYEFDEETIDLLKLAASELVTNSLLHSGAQNDRDEIVVSVRVTAPTLLLKVCDRGPGVIERTHQADLMSEGGRGLFLVEAISQSWGTSTVDIDGEDWSCVWACFGADALACKDVG